MHKNLIPYYERVKADVKKTGNASKKSIWRNFHYLSWSELASIHDRLKEEKVIADNPDGWLCEVIRGDSL